MKINQSQSRVLLVLVKCKFQSSFISSSLFIYILVFCGAAYRHEQVFYITMKQKGDTLKFGREGGLMN